MFVIHSKDGTEMGATQSIPDAVKLCNELGNGAKISYGTHNLWTVMDAPEHIESSVNTIEVRLQDYAHHGRI